MTIALDGVTKIRYLKCHICETPYNVESIAMMCCDQEKEWDEYDSGTWYLAHKGDWLRVPV